jgi:thiamine-monophosphate kinase
MGDSKQFQSELEFVDWLKRRASGRAAGLVAGIGDDAAVIQLQGKRDLLLKTELSIEGVHFLNRLHPARSVGHRALARGLSDIAAMGGRPRLAMVSLALGRHAGRAWVEDFYSGLLALAGRFGVALIGGDTSVVPGATMVDVILAGEAEPGRALLRSGARPGDQIYISGRLGLSALGLEALKHPKGRIASLLPRAEIENALRAHLYPEPRCKLGRYLSRRRLASAAMDISDGLSLDLLRLCGASGVGAKIWEDRIPLPGTSFANKAMKKTCLDFALYGGEDYELLFTVAKKKLARLPRRIRGVEIHHIGEMTAKRGIALVRPDGREEPLKPAGYDHFSFAKKLG